MRLLLLSLWYSPEPVAKPHDLASELVKRGHQVTVITSFPTYPAGRVYEGYRVRAWGREQIDGVDVLRVPAVIDRSRSGGRRVASYASFAAAASVAGIVAVRRPQVIWTYQIGLPGIMIAGIKGARLVHEVQDLWPEWAGIGNMGLSGGAYQILNRQERMIYRHAHAVTTISNGFKRSLMAKGVPANKIEVIPNWANEQNFRPVPRDETLAAAEGLTNRFNVVYGGNIGTAQGLSVVLDAAEHLRDLPSIQFVIIGDGVEREVLSQQAIARGLLNVRFLGSRAPEQMAGYLALADVLLLHLKQDPFYEITIPSKTYAYLASGRPILAAASGDVAELITDLGAGVVCAAEDPSGLANAVRRLYVTDGSERKKLGEAGRCAFSARFTRQVLVDRYEALFASVASHAVQR